MSASSSALILRPRGNLLPAASGLQAAISALLLFETPGRLVMRPQVASYGSAGSACDPCLEQTSRGFLEFVLFLSMIHKQNAFGAC